MSAARITLKNGSLYVDRALYDLYFAGLDSVILLRRDDDLVILPVRHAGAGGYFLKRRNGAGDRVVTAPDFFRSHAMDDAEHEFAVVWVPETAGLVTKAAFAAKKVVSP